MSGLAGLGFAQPALLAALVALPALWWLLRLIPPPPRRAVLPTIALLGPAPDQLSDRRPPWWLMALRLLLAALIVLACAGPVLRPPEVTGQGPLVLVIDNGWPAAARFPAVQEAARTLVRTRVPEARRVLLITTAPPAGGWPAGPLALEPLTPALALARINALTPQAWPTDRAGLAARLAGRLPRPAELVWLSDGVGTPGAADLARQLAAAGPVELARGSGVVAIRKLAPSAAGWKVELVRLAEDIPRPVPLVARDRAGRTLGEAVAQFEPGARSTIVDVPVAAQDRPATTALAVVAAPSAGAVALLDASNVRPLAGLAGREAGADRQPLRSGEFYVRRALEPRAQVREGTVEALIEAGVGLMVLVDTASLPDATSRRLLAWVEAGGVLLQFAGPRTAESGVALPPVPLRLASRGFGGTMSWGEPLNLAAFPATSPFAGLAVPADVTVSRQLLADPDPQLDSRTWAALADGTPLVTAAGFGQGLAILVHTTASPDWTDLPLSGLFDALFERIVPLVGRARAATQGAPTGPLVLAEALDGNGDLSAPTGLAARIEPTAWDSSGAGPTTPPGLYTSGALTRALNLFGPLGPIGPTATLDPLPDLPGLREITARQGPTDLRPWLLLAAALLLVVDTLVSVWLRGLWPAALSGRGLKLRGPALARPVAAAAMLAGVAGTLALPVPAQAADSARVVQLGYVAGGNPAAEPGLVALTRLVGLRTAVRMGPPIAVDPARDALGLYPVIYWPIPASPTPLSPQAVANVSAYLANGGFILFDAARAGPSPVARARASRVLLDALGLPPLEPMPVDHVLTKSFYLLRATPGAVGSDPLWVESDTSGANGRVSSVAFGANDWAGAWAGTADDPRTRELALRFGINVVIYALTGTYKADQVHAAAVMARLGRQRRIEAPPGATPGRAADPLPQPMRPLP